MPPGGLTDLHRLIALLGGWITGQPSNDWLYANTILVSLTLVVLIWYTIETSNLRKEAQRQNAVTTDILTEARRQNELATMPILALYLDLTGREERLVLKNVGEAPAFNVEIETHPTRANPPTGEHEISLSLPNNILAPREEQNLRILAMMADGRGPNMNSQQLCQWMNSGYLATPVELIVHCSTLDCKPYRFVFRFANEGGRPHITYNRHVRS